MVAPTGRSIKLTVVSSLSVIPSLSVTVSSIDLLHKSFGIVQIVDSSNQINS